MEGASPGTEGFWGPLFLIPMLMRKWFIVAVTTDAVLVFDSSVMTPKVGHLIAAWPGHEAFGTPTDGMSPTITVAGRTLKIYLKWVDEARRISRVLTRA
jgi:hypothetical protein